MHLITEQDFETLHFSPISFLLQLEQTALGAKNSPAK
jgi:hypothetical protein